METRDLDKAQEEWRRLTVSEHQPVMPVRAFFTPCFDKQLSGSIVTWSLLPLEALRGMGT